MLAITGHIFVIIALGYLALWFEIIPREGARVLGAFALYFALPALIFKSTSERELAEILHPEYLLVYVSASLAAFVVVYVYARRVLHVGMTSASILRWGEAFPIA